MSITTKKELLFLFAILNLLFRIAASDPSSECRTVVDLCLVIDGSDSISKSDYEKQRDATANLMTNLDIGDNRARAGLVVFSTAIAEEVPLSSDKELLIKRAQSLPHPRDGTNTALGIKTMRSMFQSYGRPETPRIGIVITDGISKDPKLTMEEAQKARQEGVSLIAVGVTTLIDSNELLNIAGVESRVLKLESFDELKGSLAGLAKTICPCDAPPVIDHTVISPGPRTVGTVRLYECLEGYRGLGSGQIACLENSTWTIPTLECVACPEPPLVMNAVVDAGDKLIKSLRKFHCNPGYIPSGPTVVECLANTTWSKPEFECITCPEPPLVNNALMQPGSNLIGSVRQYVCEDGFLATGSTTIECSPDGGWTLPKFSCIVCKDTPLVPNAKIRPGSYLIGTVRTYDCMEGYKATGPTDILCLKDAIWSKPDFTCITCMDPPVVPNAVVDMGSNLIGAIRNYQCVKGFLSKGGTSIMCREDAKWSPPEFDCYACQDPPLVQHALLEPGSNLIGSNRNYICERGYVATGPTVVECLPDATWAPQQFTCIGCTDPPLVPNSVVDIGFNLIGSVRTYTCKDGFLAKGETSIVCQLDAHWSPAEFICDVCGALPIVKNAEILAGPHLIGSVRQYRCMDGLLATGPTDIICQKDATWSATAFQCISCGEVPQVDNAMILSGSHLIGSIRIYQCVKGFIHSSSTEIMCQKDATWSVPKFLCIACTNTPLVKNAVINPGESLIGSTRTYTCEDGYFAKGNTEITCLPDAKWSAPTFVCDVCGTEPSVDKAVILPGSNLVGSIRFYQCAKGLLPSGPTKIVCQEDGTWSLPMFNCIGCGIPPLVRNAIVSPGESFIGEFRTYTCNEGLIPTGPAGIVCQDNATWTPAAFTCVECRSLVDMIVVVDGSDSINAPGYEMLRGAIVTLVPELDMGDEKARVGIVVFSSDIHEVIPLTGNSTSLISKVKYLHHPRDGTNTAKGIQKMREMFQSNGRQDVPWLGIVITDGISKQPLQTKQEAESAKAEGVYMISVGVTDKINQQELQDIASSPKQVLQLETFDQLSKELIHLMRIVCRKKTPSLLQSILEVKNE